MYNIQLIVTRIYGIYSWIDDFKIITSFIFPFIYKQFDMYLDICISINKILNN